MSEIIFTTQDSLNIIKTLHEGDVDELFIQIGKYLENNNIVFSKVKLKPIEMHCISILDK